MSPPASHPVGTTAPPPEPRWRRLDRGTLWTAALILLMVGTGLLAMLSVSPRREDGGLARPGDADLVLVGGAPSSWDPADIMDGTSAQMLAQVYEGLTAFDAGSQIRPALAESWSVEDGGLHIDFRLRPGMAFSDGTPITAADVRRSWLRALDPLSPSPLAGLLDDVRGATAYRLGTGSTEDVAITPDGDVVRVGFDRPAAYFPAIAASPTLGIVPRSAHRGRGGLLPGDVVASGAYLPVEQTADRIRLAANPAHWAGSPSLETITILSDTGGRSLVRAFQDEVVDWTTIARSDVPWVRYDRKLGPQLRRWDELAVDFVGFDTTRPPFHDARVRRAVAMAVDWRRISALAQPDAPVATSLVPRGIPGRGEEDFLPAYDPEAARDELAAAGYPRGEGFPRITFATYGVGEPEAVARELARELGMSLDVELRPFAELSALLDADSPHMWSLSWSADYPHPHDFLGLLLRSGSSANPGGWSDPRFDALIDEAASTADAAEQERLYAQAQRIVRDEAPLIPLRYGVSWALSRDGLLGAAPSGMGILRYAGMAWQR